MISKIKTKLLAISTLFLIAIPVALPVAVSAQEIQGNLCRGASNLDLTQQSANTCNTSVGTTDESTFQKYVKDIVNILSIIVGIIAVIMIVVGGFRYITSGGKAESVTGAKNTILYALIGLIIVALAQVIVRFVLSKATSTT